MKKTILIAAASTFLLASGALAGLSAPGIDSGASFCSVFYDDGEPAYISGDHIKVTHTVEADNDVSNLNAVCHGQEDDLAYDSKKPVHFDYDETGKKCGIYYDSYTHYTEKWHLVLRPDGAFSLTCHGVMEIPD